MSTVIDERLSRKVKTEKGLLQPIPLETAEYRSGLACSLYETILEKASEECSQQLVDLISLAYDINHEIHRSLEAVTGIKRSNIQ